MRRVERKKKKRDARAMSQKVIWQLPSIKNRGFLFDNTKKNMRPCNELQRQEGILWCGMRTSRQFVSTHRWPQSTEEAEKSEKEDSVLLERRGARPADVRGL